MKANFTINDPKEIECTMTITMRLKDWEHLKSQLVHDHPSWNLTRSINELISDARKVFYAEHKELE